MRTFISLPIPPEIIGEIGKIQKQLPKFNGKLIELENLHLTLKFLGDISSQMLDNVKNCLKRIKFSALNLSLGEIGTFDHEGMPKIAWIKIHDVESLQNKIDLALSELFKPEERFMSHLTIARIKLVDSVKHFKETLPKITYQKKEFNVKSFHLMESVLSREGPKYAILERYSSSG